MIGVCLFVVFVGLDYFVWVGVGGLVVRGFSYVLGRGVVGGRDFGSLISFFVFLF